MPGKRATGSSPSRLQVAEPGGSYRQRPPLVADASVVAAVVFGERGRDEALALLYGRTLHAPHLLDCEIASVALKKARDGIASDTIAATLQAFARMPIERHAVDAGTIASIAARFSLSAYDAAYLCIADELAAPLATLDKRLAQAARQLLSPQAPADDD